MEAAEKKALSATKDFIEQVYLLKYCCEMLDKW